jgi:AraC-like DNA-binding protein
VASTELSYLYLRPLDTEEAIRQLLEDLFRDMEERTSASDQALRSKIEAVARYIQENYQDCNLCLAKLCDVFQMNQSYLSRTFKNIFGIGILDFIHKQRLIHVKQQLQEPDSNIDTIWHSVGYTNRRTFNRTFRRLEGMSASEYRKKLLLPEA